MLTTQIGMSLLNIPYQWGGKNPLSGFDCSGLTQWVMTSLGFDLVRTPLNAAALYKYFLNHGVKIQIPAEGALVFFGDPIDHVGICVDSRRMIEAYNGNEYVTTRNIAQMRGACVRVSPLSIRSDLNVIVMPTYESVGM